MYAIVDIEWAVYKDRQSLTQLAAIKVDDGWRSVASFSSLIKPQNASFEDWKQACYNGAKPKDFLRAPSVATVLRDFENWLGDGYILLFWHKSSCEMYVKMVSILLKGGCTRKCIALSEYVTAVVGKKQSASANLYKLAEKERLLMLEAENISACDIALIRHLMEKARLAPSQLLQPPPKREHKSAAELSMDQPYQLDTVTGLLHKKGSPCIPLDHTMQGYTSIATCLKKEHTPCPICMAEEMKEARIAKNRDTLDRSQYNYAYIQDSRTFHKCTCSSLLATKKPILGVVTYDKAIQKDKIPCKKCNPTPEDTPKPPSTPEARAAIRKNKDKDILQNAYEVRALKRHEAASKERTKALHIGTLTEQEKKDLYTLTQPEFAFWAVKGYATFHLRHCSKLEKLSNYQGFKYYSQAVKAGFRPCRECRPTAKQDVALSIPLANKRRENETAELLARQCEEAGYPYQEKGDYFLIFTPVGEWEVDKATQPIRLRHKNLVVGGDFHDQPRVFLSFSDAFFYIDRHDKKLMEKLARPSDVDDGE